MIDNWVFLEVIGDKLEIWLGLPNHPESDLLLVLSTEEVPACISALKALRPRGTIELKVDYMSYGRILEVLSSFGSWKFHEDYIQYILEALSKTKVA